METGAGLADADFGSEGNFDAVLGGDIADDPLGEDQMIGHDIDGFEVQFDFELFQAGSVAEGDGADFGVAVFDVNAHRSEMMQDLVVHIIKFGEGFAFVVVFLGLGGEHVILGFVKDIIFEFAEGREVNAGFFDEFLMSHSDNVFGGDVGGMVSGVIVVAKHIQGGPFGERI